MSGENGTAVADPEVVDAEVMPDETPATTDTSSAEVAVVEAAGTATGVLMPYDADEVESAMKAYQAAVQTCLDRSDWQGEPNADGSFVKKSGWRKIAKAFGLSVSRVESGVERNADGDPIRAYAVYRATAPNGQSQDGDGYCSADEPRFQAAKGRQKLENDMRATATTRAKNRAISDLVGMGEVSAEEMPNLGSVAYDGDMAPVWAEIVELVGEDSTRALSEFVLNDNENIVPRNVGRALAALTRLTAGRRQESPPEDQPYDLARLIHAADAMKLPSSKRQPITAWAGVDKDGNVAYPDRLKTAIERVENGDVDGLLTMIEAGAGA